jgi:hypothetical protein
VRDLYQDTSPIAGVFFTATPATMVEVFENCEGLFHNLVGALAFDMDHKTNAARIVFERRIVQALLGRNTGVFVCWHVHTPLLILSGTTELGELEEFGKFLITF